MDDQLKLHVFGTLFGATKMNGLCGLHQIEAKTMFIKVRFLGAGALFQLLDALDATDRLGGEDLLDVVHGLLPQSGRVHRALRVARLFGLHLRFGSIGLPTTDCNKTWVGQLPKKRGFACGALKVGGALQTIRSGARRGMEPQGREEP